MPTKHTEEEERMFQWIAAIFAGLFVGGGMWAFTADISGGDSQIIFWTCGVSGFLLFSPWLYKLPNQND